MKEGWLNKKRFWRIVWSFTDSHILNNKVCLNKICIVQANINILKYSNITLQSLVTKHISLLFRWKNFNCCLYADLMCLCQIIHSRLDIRFCLGGSCSQCQTMDCGLLCKQAMNPHFDAVHEVVYDSQKVGTFKAT